ncbi:hypothetical protein N7523_001944 [Penicillium sp. IBT 18751x]|nr:hypothetical protein N7523_001944 [Penicillium sp. IBT 18751x]
MHGKSGRHLQELAIFVAPRWSLHHGLGFRQPREPAIEMDYQVNQRLALTVHNNLVEGTILLKDIICFRGQPYQQGDPPKLIPLEDVKHISVPHGDSRVVSFCGSATFGLGVEGKLDLYRDGKHRITSVYWNGPWSRLGNQLHLVSVDEQHYDVTLSVPPEGGILGDLAIVVREVYASQSPQGSGRWHEATATAVWQFECPRTCLPGFLQFSLR